VADDIPIDYYLIKYDIYDEFNKTKPIYTELVYSAVKEGNTELLKLVNTGLERISKREMESIHRRWFGKPIKLFKTRKYVLWISLIGSIVIISMILWNRSMSIRVEKATRELEKRTEELRQAYKQLKNREKELRETLSKLAKQNWEMQRVSYSPPKGGELAPPTESGALGWLTSSPLRFSSWVFDRTLSAILIAPTMSACSPYPQF